MGDRGIGRLAAVLIVLSACALCGCGEGTGQAPPAAGPPIAARSFNSDVPFRIWVVREEEGTREYIGYTPAAEPIMIPACWVWGVTLPPGKGKADMRAVAQEMAAQNIPGLQINSATDADLANLKDLRGLRVFVLINSYATDAGLAHLKELKGLEALNLSGTQETDTSLEHLDQLQRLQRLDLSDTKVTAAGVEEFKRAMPNVHVEH